MNKKVLIIEDNDDIRENVIEILELAGYTVASASNGKAGVELAFSDIPDIILCDIMMPELDGYGVLYMLSKRPETIAIPFIAFVIDYLILFDGSGFPFLNDFF